MDSPILDGKPLLEEYDWGTAPEGLATRRQLRAQGLRPAGQTPIVLRCRKCRNYPERVCTWPTFLYRIDRALPVRPMTLAQERALDRAMEARQRCPKRCRRCYHVIPLRSLGSCLLRTTGVVRTQVLGSAPMDACRRCAHLPHVTSHRHRALGPQAARPVGTHDAPGR
ncbi:RRQRL motif-containing zinc-binding protein [Streptomyces sp. NBC_00151]|uniref:RRQRL motif-containing zinc-binding protein n=1 Tax=Streptomyces sp. NBC_00151 TaxID=2975669 RepID=UPI002DD853CE|nr:RRQRL motif-containing zinc-binding protein [Streptomyces sp. NBC_00151]